MGLSYDSLGINFGGANFTMSDEDGNVQFYTNGITIKNALDETIENGDSLHNGFYLQNLASFYYYGNPYDAIMNVLPNPLQNNRYDIFYGYADTIPNSTNVYVPKLMRTHLDMSENLGLGKVLYKDRVFDTIISSGSLAAVKHGNGRDWWLVSMKENTDCYQIFLYDGTDTIRYRPLNCTGGYIYGRAQTVVHRFSPDGNYMMSTNSSQGRVDFYAFNRCNGSLVLQDSYVFPEKFDSTFFLFTGCEFSPNSRYAYVCGNRRLYQFDMNAFPIAPSKTVIANYYPQLQPTPVTYNLAQLGPDGKIYISSRNGTYYMAVINNPDEAGAACNFQDTVKLPSFILGLPFYPNYRLGVQANSPCDTLTAINDIAEKEKILKVFPNPAVDVVTIDYGYTDWSKGEATMEIANNLGQIVHTQKLPMYSGFQKLDVANYPSGSYTVYIKRKNTVVASGRLVKE